MQNLTNPFLSLCTSTLHRTCLRTHLLSSPFRWMTNPTKEKKRNKQQQHNTTVKLPYKYRDTLEKRTVPLSKNTVQDPRCREESLCKYSPEMRTSSVIKTLCLVVLLHEKYKKKPP